MPFDIILSSDPPTPPPPPPPPAGDVNVLDYGADPTGLADSYQAFKDAIASFSKGTFTIPPGHYKIDQYRIEGGANANGVTDLIFEGLSGFVVRGIGAVLDMKGDFQRTDDFNNHFSYSNGVKLLFRNCQRFTVEGLEIDGNVDQMTRESGVNEDGSGLIYTNACRDYTLRNVYAHHGQSDGFIIGQMGWYDDDVDFADQNGRIESCVAEYNARQGISIIQARGLKIVNSRFDHTGQSEGEYGWHEPGHGADVEPNVASLSGIVTGNILFDTCQFENNIGGTFTSSSGGAIIQGLVYHNCYASPGEEGSGYTILSGVLVIAQGCFFDDCDVQTFNPATFAVVVDNLFTRSEGYMFSHQANTKGAYVQRNRFICTFAEEMAEQIIYMLGKGSYEDNYLYVPKEAIGAGNTSAVYLNGATRILGNTYETDLLVGANSFVRSNGSVPTATETFVGKFIDG